MLLLSRGQRGGGNQSPSQRRTMPLDLTHSSFREYNVTLSSGEVMYILARSSEDAAWDAMELAADRSLTVIDVRLTDEW